MPDNKLYPPEPKKSEWNINWPWDWTPGQSEYYESLPFSQRPFSWFGMKPPTVPFPEPPAQEGQFVPPTLEQIMSLDISLEEKDLMVKQWQPSRYNEWKQQIRELAAQEEAMQPPKFPTTTPPEGYQWIWSDSRLAYVLEPVPYGKAQSQAELDLARKKEERAAKESTAATRARQKEQTFAQKQYQEQQAWEEKQAGVKQQQYEEQMRMEQQQYMWQRQQAEQQAEQERRNYLANLAAQPRSWLEYAAASGATPMVQPWMTPLMPQQYEGTVAGSALPGWGNVQTSMNEPLPSMAQLPALTTPSAQYLARMGPTAYQQYSGYEQARSGINPSELEFRLWSSAPPSGQNRQLSYAR